MAKTVLTSCRKDYSHFLKCVPANCLGCFYTHQRFFKAIMSCEEPFFCFFFFSVPIGMWYDHMEIQWMPCELIQWERNISFVYLLMDIFQKSISFPEVTISWHQTLLYDFIIHQDSSVWQSRQINIVIKGMLKYFPLSLAWKVLA